MSLVQIDRPAEGVVVLTLNDPDRRNVMSDEMTAQWVEAIAALKVDREVRCVVVEVRQVQAGAPFVMPLEVAIEVPGAAARVERLQLGGAVRRFTFAAERAPSGVTLDPEVRALFEGGLTRR